MIPALAVALALTFAPATQDASKLTPRPVPVDCKLSHPAHAGACVERVTPEKRQTPLKACQAVLACLNNPLCVKTYCGATTVRGGWTLDSPKPPPAPKP